MLLGQTVVKDEILAGNGRLCVPEIQLAHGIVRKAEKKIHVVEIAPQHIPPAKGIFARKRAGEEAAREVIEAERVAREIDRHQPVSRQQVDAALFPEEILHLAAAHQAVAAPIRRIAEQPCLVRMLHGHRVAAVRERAQLARGQIEHTARCRAV